ncbi:hypothetical protein [Aliirhizobium smilacinae]|uniref:Uncharacterized protein n=1 Tax=Aliirhizobium smilacinae TaxID=1395944 RepID=A0A5C4XBB7_9HYPH|nr:hypothetical protein [Rhizobium smilacinae]TNM60765.1 hypothetical protein FHP24_23470 [Rhizobium smilacinae]
MVTAGGGASYAGDFKIRYAISLEGDEPVFAEARCVVSVPCEIEAQGQRLSLTAFFNRLRLDELTIRCGKVDCDFSNSRSSINFGKSKDKIGFDVFEASDVGDLLLLRPRRQIGWIMLAY